MKESVRENIWTKNM